MATKLGVHITGGPRSGYNDVARAIPAVVVSLDGGALQEAKSYGGDRVITIFRTQEVFGDYPAGLPHWTERQQAIDAADGFWPALLAKMRLNPGARYLQPTNESVGNSEQSLRNLIWFETRLMELAERDGVRLALGSFAGGSPGDIELWRQYVVPFLRRAAEGGHVCSRHAYGGIEPDGNGLLTRVVDGEIMPADWNAGRPFIEARILKEEGVTTPIVLTEAGQLAGYDFVGAQTFIADHGRYDTLCQQHENIWAFAAWTYGTFAAANMEAASPELAAYLRAQGGASKPVWPVWEDGWQQALIDAADEYSTTNPDAALQKWILAHPPWRPYGKETWEAVEGTLYAVQTAIDWTDPAHPRRHAYAKVPEWDKVAWVEDVQPGGDFAFSHWPTNYRVVTQVFGNRPEYYGQWNLPGHEGVDLRAYAGTPVYAVAAGTVVEVDKVDNSPYGIFLVIRHPEGYETLYAHLQAVDVALNQVVSGGQQIARADNTGNSDGHHLHLTLYRPGHTYRDEHGEWPLSIHDPTPFLAPFLEEPPPPAVDLLDYVRGDGRAYTLHYTWNGGGSHPVQTQQADGRFYIVKGGGQYEELWADDVAIYRGIDTSEDHDKYYIYYTPAGGDLRYGGRWVRRHMRVGDVSPLTPYIVHYWQATCEKRGPEGQPGWSITLVARHDEYTFPSGITLEDVVELKWNEYERYWFARGYGLVGWDGTGIGFGKSYIERMLPDGTRLERVPPPCL